MSKISVIGAGSVGATIANDLMIQGIASEIVLVDINKKKARGEALDVYQGAPFQSPAIVRPGDYPDTANSDIVVITCGIPRKPGMTRLDLAQTNVNILKDVCNNVVQYSPKAIYVIVSNPVDILTYVFTKISGIPESRIIGSGTQLDSARLCATLAEKLDVNQKDVHAFVLGEHGDTSFVPWSMATVAGVKIDDYCRGAFGGRKFDIDYDDVVKYVRESGGMVIKRKGATYYAIAVSVCRIIEMLDMCDNGVAVVSTMMHGEYGVDDVCISTPCIVGPHGIKGKLLVSMTDEEIEKLRASGRAMKAAMEALTY
ncbi:MAG: L-lactate dehydrogenase [Clostridiales bacterium]|nr:L-lactate dehydrogenase [Clostridiales bacterium]